MYPILLRFLCNLLSFRPCSIVRIVNDDLATGVEEIPNKLLAASGDLSAKRDRFGALLAYCIPSAVARAASRKREDLT